MRVGVDLYTVDHVPVCGEGTVIGDVDLGYIYIGHTA